MFLFAFQITMVTDAEHLTWSAAGDVQGFRLKSAGSGFLQHVSSVMKKLCWEHDYKSSSLVNVTAAQIHVVIQKMSSARL